MTKRLFVAVAVVAGLVAVNGAPAQAARGGGCKDTSAIGACISISTTNLVSADFYMNRPPDSSMCKATLTIVNKGRAVKSASYNLTRTGRYGPISYSVATLPPSAGSAYSKVDVYTCSGARHFTATSPTLYY